MRKQRIKEFVSSFDDEEVSLSMCSFSLWWRMMTRCTESYVSLGHLEPLWSEREREILYVDKMVKLCAQQGRNSIRLVCGKVSKLLGFQNLCAFLA
jgi:hypothetical protein